MNIRNLSKVALRILIVAAVIFVPYLIGSIFVGVEYETPEGLIILSWLAGIAVLFLTLALVIFLYFIGTWVITGTLPKVN